MNYKEKILARINSYDHKKVFIVKNFIDLADPVSVRKALNELVKEKIIVRIMAGLYNKPVMIEIINRYSRAPPAEVALAFARRNNWNLYKNGDEALNELGMCTQVPANYLFLTNGNSTKFRYGNLIIMLKHVNHKDICNKSQVTTIVIQALKALGKNWVTPKYIEHLKRRIPDELKPILLAESKTTTYGVYRAICKICEK